MLEDITQLLDARLSQTEERIVTQLRGEVREAKDELRAEIKQSANEIRTEMHQGFAGVGEPISAINDQIDDHESRLTKLETKTA